jgi:hypothetical protein
MQIRSGDLYTVQFLLEQGSDQRSSLIRYDCLNSHNNHSMPITPFAREFQSLLVAKPLVGGT